MSVLQLDGMEQFRKFVAQRLADGEQGAGPHPDTNVLAAFVEQSLGSIERKQVLGHLSTCADCREIVALSSSSLPREAEVANKSVVWWRLRWTSVAAVACLVGLVVWRHPAPPPAPMKAETKVLEQAHLALPAALTPAPKQIAAALPRAKKQAVVLIPKRVEVVVPETPPLQTASLPVPVEPLVIPDDALKKAKPSTPASLSFLELPQRATDAVAKASSGMLPRDRFTKSLAFAPRSGIVWGIDSNGGRLRSSSDGGKTWLIVPVDNKTNLMSLVVHGTDIWTGGELGALFHSTNNGTNWLTVPVQDGDQRVQGDIIGIKTEGSETITVKTKLGDWTSQDGGAHWHKE